MERTDVAAELARLTSEVSGLRGDVGDLKEKVDATNGRVRKLEVWRAGIIGALAVLGWLIANNVDPGVVHGAFPSLP